MTLRHYVCSTRWQSRRCPVKSKSPFSYGACWPGEWLWVDSNPTDGKPTLHRRANLSWFSKIYNHFREIAAWRRKSLTMTTVFFWKKRPLKGKFKKKCFRKDSPRHRTTFCVQIWLTRIGKVVRCLPDRKNKTSARFPALASARIAPKICQGQLQTISSEFPKFHPNPFTSGGVIAERVNIVETRHKVFPFSNTRRSFFAE